MACMAGALCSLVAAGCRPTLMLQELQDYIATGATFDISQQLDEQTGMAVRQLSSIASPAGATSCGYSPCYCCSPAGLCWCAAHQPACTNPLMPKPTTDSGTAPLPLNCRVTAWSPCLCIIHSLWRRQYPRPPRQQECVGGSAQHYRGILRRAAVHRPPQLHPALSHLPWRSLDQQQPTAGPAAEL